jgi:hypothetical protein
VEVAERYAEGQATNEERATMELAAYMEPSVKKATDVKRFVREAAAYALSVDGWGAAAGSAVRVAAAGPEVAMCRLNLLRDIFGNPFHPLPPQRGKRRWEE